MTSGPRDAAALRGRAIAARCTVAHCIFTDWQSMMCNDAFERGSTIALEMHHRGDVTGRSRSCNHSCIRHSRVGGSLGRNPAQRRNAFRLAQRKRVEIRLSDRLAHLSHHIEICGKVGGDDAGAHVAVSQLENPQFEHFLAWGGILTMLDDAGHSLLALLERDDHDRGCDVNHHVFSFQAGEQVLRG
jgi:hypothetical protein